MAGFPVRPAFGTEEHLLDRVLDYWWFADRFGWPPSVVRGESHVLLKRLRLIGGTAEEIRAQRQREPVEEG